ncbi:response regulator [Massilia forsythiae]|uniref:Response regulator n=1 Tax=Massilia forsythiae TaxID=2728020 RepID=A0A7Z2ZRC8_9BURK|nr:response regulator [Massilia forsythiae]QJD99320.1 response regulator [Massilia forsythiae]
MSAPATSRRPVLLVDDDAVLLEYLSTVLHHAGYDTVETRSAAEALQRIGEREAAHEPDFALALLDINMPGMSGLDLARRLREHTQVAFMFLSSVDDAETARQAASHGAVGFVVKPVDAARLLPAFESALARADEIRQLRRTEANLNAALAAGRETSLAVGLLMARYQTDRNVAFEVLRDHARSSRRKINEVAEQLVAAEELLNGLHGAFAGRLRGK